MNCYYHPDRPAVVQCKECGRGFCHEEAAYFVDGVCPDCQMKKEDEIYKNTTITELFDYEWCRKTFIIEIVGIVLFLLLGPLTKFSSESAVIIYGITGWWVSIRVFKKLRIYIETQIKKNLTKGTGCLIGAPFYLLLFIIAMGVHPFFLIYSGIRLLIRRLQRR